MIDSLTFHLLGTCNFDICHCVKRELQRGAGPLSMPSVARVRVRNFFWKGKGGGLELTTNIRQFTQ